MNYSEGIDKFLWEEEGQKLPLPQSVEVRGDYKIDATIWLKWLDYEPEFEKELLKTLSSKNTSTLTLEELQILTKYQERMRISQLIKKYETDISFNEYMEANTYLETEPIEELMLDKLSQEEKEYAKIEIERLRHLPYEELDEKINEMIRANCSENLSMVDSYILHEISEVGFRRNMSRFNSKTSRSIENGKVRSIQYYPAKY